MTEECKPIEVEFEITDNPESMSASFGIYLGSQNHKDLEGRDLPDQHPISAITGLQDALDETTQQIENEKEERIAADENLQEQIDDISGEVVTEISGGSNIEVERTGNSVTISSKTFVFEQGIASDTWVIHHNLNKQPSTTLVDSAGTVFKAQEEVVDENTIIIHMNGATTGKAYLN